MLVRRFIGLKKRVFLYFAWLGSCLTGIALRATSKNLRFFYYLWSLAPSKLSKGSSLPEAQAKYKKTLFFNPMKAISFFLICIVGMTACQTPETRVSETDSGFEKRAFSRIHYGKKVDLKKVVIVDVRSHFDFEMSRLPRSFHAYWKDWDLRGLSGRHLVAKKDELQRLLSLKGVDPLTQVVILGKGLKGEGEEFLLATTLLSLGIERINFMNFDQAKKALVKKAPPLENIPYWSKDLKYKFFCDTREANPEKLKKQATIVVGKGGRSPSKFFDKNLRVRPQSFPKNMNVKIYSPNSLWAHGLALYFKDQGRNPCIL